MASWRVLINLMPDGPPWQRAPAEQKGGEGPEGGLLPGTAPVPLLVPESPQPSAPPYQRGSLEE